jgi:hypothetical protein
MAEEQLYVRIDYADGKTENVRIPEEAVTLGRSVLEGAWGWIESGKHVQTYAHGVPLGEVIVINSRHVRRIAHSRMRPRERS